MDQCSVNYSTLFTHPTTLVHGSKLTQDIKEERMSKKKKKKTGESKRT